MCDLNIYRERGRKKELVKYAQDIKRQDGKYDKKPFRHLHTCPVSSLSGFLLLPTRWRQTGGSIGQPGESAIKN